MAQDTEEAIKKKEQEAEERRQQSHNLVADTIKRELLESTYHQPTLSLFVYSKGQTRPQRRRKLKFPMLMIPTVLSPKPNSRRGGYGNWHVLNVTRRLKFEGKSSGRRSKEDAHSPRNNDSKRIWKMPSALVTRSPKASRSSCKNTGTREPSFR